MSKPQQTEYWKIQPQAHVFKLMPLSCPICQYPLSVRLITLGIFPYLYVDVGQYCENCKSWYHFCLPYEDVMPSGLTIYDKDPDSLHEKLLNTIEFVKCPFGHGYMRLSRIYGNLVYQDGTIRVQLRCDTCHYFKHITIYKEGGE